LVIVVAFFVVSALPGAQTIWRFAKEEKLHGVEEEVLEAAPAPSRSAFLSEQYQRSFESWLSRNIGFRAYFVRTDNQINFSLFHEISSNYASPLVLGKDNVLFEKLYIDALNGDGYVSDKNLRRITRRVRRLQELLEKRGVTLLIFLTPSKAGIYPEKIPPQYLSPDRPPDEQSNYARLASMLKESDVNLLDARALLQEWKNTAEQPLFARGGTHWTQLTACRVSESLMDRLRPLAPEIPALRCTPLESRSVPDPFDRDLADLCNLRDSSPLYETLLYPAVEPNLSDPPPGRPKMLFVGGSFLWSVFFYLDAFQVYSERDMFYYYSRRFHYPGNIVTPINRKELNWDDDVFGHQFIVIEVNEANIQNLGSGFVEDALSKLKESSPGSNPESEPVPEEQ